MRHFRVFPLVLRSALHIDECTLSIIRCSGLAPVFRLRCIRNSVRKTRDLSVRSLQRASAWHDWCSNTRLRVTDSARLAPNGYIGHSAGSLVVCSTRG